MSTEKIDKELRMPPARQKTHAIAEALANRLSYDQLDELRVDLDARWCDDDGLFISDAPSGASVLMFALNDACDIAKRRPAGSEASQ